MTLTSFIPRDQQEKLPLIHNTAAKLAGAFDPKNAEPPPSDADNIDALKEGAEPADRSGGRSERPRRRRRQAARRGFDGGRARQPGAARQGRGRIHSAAENGARQSASLAAGTASDARIAAGGPRARLDDAGRPRAREVAPKGNANDNEEMRGSRAPCWRSSRTPSKGRSRSSMPAIPIVHAFIEAGLWALLSIGILLWLVLRRIGDVLLTLIPLMTGGRGDAGDSAS